MHADTLCTGRYLLLGPQLACAGIKRERESQLKFRNNRDMLHGYILGDLRLHITYQATFVSDILLYDCRNP